MKLDMMINQMAHATGMSRKQVIEDLRQIGTVPDVQKYIKHLKHDQKAGK